MLVQPNIGTEKNTGQLQIPKTAASLSFDGRPIWHHRWGSYMDWFIAIDDKPEGPIKTAELGSRIASGELTPDSLVWRDGMDGWSPVRDQPELAALARRLPPPLPLKQRVDTELSEDEAFDLPQMPALPLPGSPWSRYFARQIDCILLSFTLALTVTFASFYWFPKFYYALISMPEAGAGLMWFGLSFLANAIIITIFGNSIGKTIFGLKARPITGGRPSLLWNLKREFSVWVYGLALGIPIIAFFTAIRNYTEVRVGRPARYDSYFATVEEASISSARRVGSMFFAVGIIFAGAALGAWVKESTRSVATAKAWTNTVTGNTVILPGGWTPGSMNADDGSSVKTFTSQDQVRSVFLAAEGASQFPEMSDYASAIERAVSNTFTFRGSWTVSTIGNIGILRRDAVSKAENMAVSYVMWKRSGRYWRIVIIDGLATPGTALEKIPIVEQLIQSVL